MKATGIGKTAVTPLSKHHHRRDETLRFEGVLTYSDKPAEGIDMFLKHQVSGQLEAARIRKDGSFEFDFRINNFNPTDKFEVIVANISSHPVQQINGLSETINPLNIQL